MNPTKRREKRVAKEYGGRRVPASGALPGRPRDVHEPGVFLMEHKKTSKDRYRFDVRDFLFLEEQCREPLPIYLVDVRGTEIALVRERDFPGGRIISVKYPTIGLGPQHLGAALGFVKEKRVLRVITKTQLRQLIREVRNAGRG